MGTIIKATAIVLAFSAFGKTAAAEEAFKPAAINFGLTLEAARTELKAHCTTVDEKRIDPPELPGTQSDHIQLDCHGFEFGGKKRLAEFAFRDGQLVLVWVLTDKEEEQGLEAKMRAVFGKPSHQSGLFTAFATEQSALRKDKPEVLFYAKSVAPMFASWFDQSVAAEAGK